jgi:vacuolar iron transporter family protein
LSKNHEHFVDVMMVEELGIMPPDPDEDQMKMGLVTFGSFCLFGLVPMASYVYASIFGVKAPQERFNGLFISCAILTLGTLFVLGAITARFTSSDWKKSGGWLVLTGGIASAAAFFIGYILNEVVKVPTTV